MADVQTAPVSFTTISYVTKDGEKCTATKKDGIVTVQGDKNGVREIPVNDFMKELVETLPKVDLEKNPKKDTVNFSGRENNDDKKLRNKYLAIATGTLAVLGTALFFIGKGRWWMKGTKQLETKGEEIIDNVAENMKENINIQPSLIISAGKKDTVGQVIDDLVVKGHQKAAETAHQTQYTEGIIPKYDNKPALPAPKKTEQHPTIDSLYEEKPRAYNELEDIIGLEDDTTSYVTHSTKEHPFEDSLSSIEGYSHADMEERVNHFVDRMTM